jgi:Tfp pilus assembly protein PilF
MKADFYNQAGEYLKARDAFREVIRYDSTKYLVWEQLVLIERELGDYPALANESYRALNLFPQYSILFYLNAFANFKLQDYSKAEESINLGKAFCYSPKQQADFFILLGKLKINENQYETAEKYFTEALKIDPNNTSVFCERALMMLKKGDSKTTAEELLNQACTKDPNNADHWFSFSSFYYKTENYENALKSIQKAKALARFRPEIYVLEGDILIKQNKTKEAIQSWKKAIELGSYLKTNLQTKINQYERY